LQAFHLEPSKVSTTAQQPSQQGDTVNTKTLKYTLLDGQNTKRPPKRSCNEGMEKAQPLQTGSTTVDKKRAIGEEGSRGTATQLINDLFISVISGNSKGQTQVLRGGDQRVRSQTTRQQGKRTAQHARFGNVNG